MMIKEHDRVVLTAPVPAEGLEVGDVGTVVHVYPDCKAFEVEFTTLDGKTAAVATVGTRRSAGHQSRNHAFSRADQRPLIRRQATRNACYRDREPKPIRARAPLERNLKLCAPNGHSRPEAGRRFVPFS